MTRKAMITHRLELSQTDLAAILSQFQDFVWLDSATQKGISIMAFAASDHREFLSYTPQSEFADFFKKSWQAGKERSWQFQEHGFDGGWIGYFCYEAFLFNDLIGFKPSHLPHVPLASFNYYDNFVFIDHQTSEKIFVSFAANGAAVWDFVVKLFRDYPPTCFTDGHGRLWLDGGRPQGASPTYQQNFKKIKNKILAGDYFELNYSIEHRMPFDGDPLHFYLKLRETSPAPMMAYLQINGLKILSASPERFFSCQDDCIKTFPIKGTIARDNDFKTDQNNQDTLAHSSKDKAELLMVTDMLRNDLGRICETGSVNVNELHRVATFSHYHHLVSEIEGTVKSGTNFFDVFDALFPGGSITGAPKIAVMRHINELEQRPRGVYTGALGYISNNGCLDFNIPIRTAVISDSEISFATGSGIVADSDVQKEFNECEIKSKGFFETLRAVTEFVGTLVVLLFCLTSTACGDAETAATAAEEDNIIVISNYQFLPDSIEAEAGATVIFFNDDDIGHWIKSQSAVDAFDATGDIDSAYIASGELRSVTLPNTLASGSSVLFYDDILKGVMATPNGEITIP